MKFQLYKLYRKTWQKIYAANEWMISACVSLMEITTKTFITYHIRPQSAEKHEYISGRDYVYPHSAIVIQGPVVVKNDFTLETIRRYKKYFPQAIIILSTWDDIGATAYKQIQREHIEMILNKKPEFSGYKNINLQIISTAAGIMRAKSKGAEYILKTRTDQRFYHPHLLPFLYKTIESFPISAVGTQQNNRLIFSSASKRSQYRLYDASDMMMFGHADDVDAYWKIQPLAMGTTLSVDAPEQHLMTAFLARIGHEPMNTVDDSLYVFRHYCIILDLPALDFYWFKYERHKEYKDIRYTSDEPHTISFLEWLSLYADSK